MLWSVTFVGRELHSVVLRTTVSRIGTGAKVPGSESTWERKFHNSTAVQSSVELVMASVLRRTLPTYVASSSSSLDAVAGVGSVYSVYQFSVRI